MDLDDPEYIRRAGWQTVSGRPNVAALSAGVSSSQLDQLVSLIAHPGGRGVPSPQRYSLSIHHLEHRPHETQPYCLTEGHLAVGDGRVDLCRTTGPWENQYTPQRTIRRRLSNLIDRSIELALNS